MTGATFYYGVSRPEKKASRTAPALPEYTMVCVIVPLNEGRQINETVDYLLDPKYPKL